MIHEEICTYEVAKLAKEKGFDEYEACSHLYEVDERWYTLTKYNNAKYIDWSKSYFYVAPTQSLLQRWLREEKGYYVYPFFDNESRRWTWVCRELTGDKWIQLLDFEERYFDTYELALEDALKYALEKFI